MKGFLFILKSHDPINYLVLSSSSQGFVCLSSLVSYLWRGGVPPPGSLPLCQALPEQPNALLRGGGHCHRYLMVFVKCPFPSIWMSCSKVKVLSVCWILNVWLYSELVSALVRVFPQPSSERPEHGGERSGSSWQGTATAPGGLWHHLTGSSSTRQHTIWWEGWTSVQTPGSQF